MSSNKMIIRKNQANASKVEWANFIGAINEMMVKDDPNKPSKYEAFVECHVKAFTTHDGFKWGAHGDHNFLVWHRDFLWHFEQELRKINSETYIPYWDWITYRKIPEYMGLDRVIEDNGQRANVTRNANPDFSRVANENDLDALKGTTSFSAFSQKVEASPFHNLVHVVVGGTMASADSPADPLFWLHHCFIDKLFADWQLDYPNQEHADMDELLKPAPYLTHTIRQIWDTSKIKEEGYQYE